MAPIVETRVVRIVLLNTRFFDAAASSDQVDTGAS